MEQDARENMELRRYLLRELPVEETLRVEARLFLESEYLEHLHAAEDDLVDEYVYEELSPDEQERFETHFLSDPERYKDLKIAEALKTYTSTEVAMSLLQAEAEGRDAVPPPSARRTLRAWAWTWGPAVRLSLAAAIVVIAFGGLWLLFRAVRRQNQPPPAQAQLPAPQGGEVTPERRSGENGINNQAGNSSPPGAEGPQFVTRNSRKQPAKGNELVPAGNSSGPRRGGEKTSAGRENNVFALLLPVGPVRGGGDVKKVTLHGSGGVVYLQLALIAEDGARSYEATLRADEGGDIKTWTGLTATRSKLGRLVSVRVPADILNQRNYSVALRGVAASGEVRDISTYPFQVQK